MPAPPADRLSAPKNLADLLLYRLYRLQTTAGARVARVCARDYGLTRREWRILSFLSAQEGLLSSELAEFAMLDRARTSRAITELTQKGLLRRQPQSSNRRQVHLFLTDEGRRVAQELFGRVVDINAALLSTLQADERVLLDRLLDRLQVQAERDGPAD